MDKFMIDKYVESNNNIEEAVVEQYPKPEIHHTYYEQEINENDIILEPVQKQTSYRFITIIGLILFIGYAIYYAAKTIYKQKNYLIKKNATSLDITLDELKTDIKNFLKTKYEDFLDWKEDIRMNSNKYFFKKHLENGEFKATKYKAVNLLSMFA
jgi:hypothetical protein